MARQALAATGERPKPPDHVTIIAVLSAATAVMFLVLLVQFAALVINPHGRDSLNQILVQAGVPTAERPSVLVSQSATGFYGPRDDQPVDEESGPGSDFLAGVVVEWEREAAAASELTRVVVTRTGVVLSSSGGALDKMLPVFRLGIGGPVAGGGQYVPWIHHEDVVQALIKCVQDDRAQGPVNVTAPEPATNAELSRALGRTLGRPAFLPVPGFAVGLLYGEMAQMVTTGQRALPKRLQELGFEFRHRDLEPALRDVLNRQ